MPILHVQLVADLNPEQEMQIADTLVQITNGVLGKRVELTAVHLDRVSPDRWFIGESSMTSRNTATYAVEIKITQGTNSGEQCADFIRQVHRFMRESLGATAETSYVVIHEIPAHAWGYGGQTQAARRAHRNRGLPV